MMKIATALFGLLTIAAFSARAEVHTVELRDDYFDPQEITIAPGDSVRWVNMGNNNQHNVNANDGSFRCSGDCDPPNKAYHGGGGTSSPGDPSSSAWETELTFPTEGEIPYHCDNHRLQGMTGTITVKQEEPPPPEGMDINYGHTGTWYKPEQSGQGFIFEVVPAAQQGEPDQLIAFWFTFARGMAGGVNRQRWYQAQGPIDGDTANLDQVQQVTGGVFDDPENVSSIDIGTVTIRFTSCTEATLTYSLDLDGDGEEETTGEIQLTRLTPDVLCEEMAGS